MKNLKSIIIPSYGSIAFPMNEHPELISVDDDVDLGAFVRLVFIVNPDKPLVNKTYSVFRKDDSIPDNSFFVGAVGPYLDRLYVFEIL